jgi:anti-sigma regulatory factor (Ser/Thr protein kinase)
MKGNRQFRAILFELDAMMNWVREMIPEQSLSQKHKKFILALEEAIVNVISYAYTIYPPGFIELECIKTPGQVDFLIKDQGVPFNPLENLKSTHTQTNLDEREMGGLGIHFIVTLTDAATYQRIDGWNVLTLTLKF